MKPDGHALIVQRLARYRKQLEDQTPDDNTALEQIKGLSRSLDRRSCRTCIRTALQQAQHEEAHLHHQDHWPDRRAACPRRLYVGADGLMTLLREA